MIHKNSKGVYESSLLAQAGIVHGYSNRRFGDLRNKMNMEKFLKELDMKPEDIVTGEQVHGTKIAHIEDGNKGKELAGIDGLVYTKDSSNLLGLGVTFADCVPILAADPGAHIIGTAHAGWKGTIAGIARELIATMKSAGADFNSMYISIGPHIGMCCYNVTEDRADAFQKRFGNDDRIATRIQGEWHLDIGYANYQLLLQSGIPKEHIDAPATCTSCQVSEFNSFRKDPKDKFGLQLGIIAL